MDYKKIYDNLINTRRNRKIDSNIIYEKHHIIPKCFGGGNGLNIIKLTFKEHFIAHKLLFKFTTGIDKTKMGFALHRMCTINNSNQKYRISTSRQFEKIKKEIYNYIRGVNHPSYGKKFPNEFCEKMSKAQMGSNNSMYGKKPWNKGLTKETCEILKLQGEKHKQNYISGKIDTSKIGNCITKEGRKNLSDFQRKFKKTKEHKEKISKSLIGRKIPRDIVEKTASKLRGRKQKIIKCPHCDKDGGEIAMYRWHFDNCKELKNG